MVWRLDTDAATLNSAEVNEIKANSKSERRKLAAALGTDTTPEDLLNIGKMSDRSAYSFGVEWQAAE